MAKIAAIAYKQSLEFVHDKSFLIQFAMMPALAFALTQLVALSDEAVSDTMFIGMFASMFAGMILITTTAGLIAGERDNGSLRLLMMSGVSGLQYLAGVMIVLLGLAGVATALFVGQAMMIGTDIAQAALMFVAMIFAVACSILMGAIIGVLSRNAASATAIALPIALLLGFAPTVAVFNEYVRQFAQFLYTMQLVETIENLYANPTQSLLIIAGNAVVLLAVFVLIVRVKGLKGM